jgi:carbamoyltransferase
MLCLGFCGGINRVFENPFELPSAFTHDGAAVLVEDGRVVAAVEEERLNRIKHSNKFPVESIRYCLKSAGARLGDVDRIAFYATEAYCNSLLSRIYLDEPDVKAPLDARTIMRALLGREFGVEVEEERIVFARHHLSHAMSAYAMSGFEDSLVLAIDGYGDFLSGAVAVGRGNSLEEIETFPQSDSLGLFYLEVIQFVGYGPFDEYKVMGLAPYGDPAPFREDLKQFYDLLPGGGYRLYLERIEPALLKRIAVRKKGQPFSTDHKNLSASLQEALETIVFHILRHRRQTSGLRHLCLAGGVAHNCTMNGKLLYSGMFDDIFVQPAAHDAGCALGAALLASQDLGCSVPRKRQREVYWGPDLDEEAIEQELGRWEGFLAFERTSDPARAAAKLMAEGAVIGWMQGRSEFGPRALGNRSILADPRPASNKDRINQMVKKREGYRPFAPSVLEEDAAEYFELPARCTELPFMIFVLNVQPDKRDLLGAVTHVDGTARVHTVSRETNPAYWAVIKAFKDLTGVPILLNTSFNNNAEPIVDTIEDAVATFLTTGLDYLVAGDWIARKRAAAEWDWNAAQVSLPPYARLAQTRSFVDMHSMRTVSEIRTTFHARVRTTISQELFELLTACDGKTTIGDLLAASEIPGERWSSVVNELAELWSQRLVQIKGLGAARGENAKLQSSAACQGAPA